MTWLSLTGPQFAATIDPLLECAAFCEEAGFRGLFLFDHLVPLGDPRRPVLELSAAAGAVAAVTRTAQIGSLVMRAPLRGTAVSAAIGLTMAGIAHGRVVVGLGAGDAQSRDEAERFGQRSESLDVRLETVRATAEWVRAHRPDVPVWIGGLHERVRRLAAEVAHGWNAWGIDPDRFADLARSLPSAVELTWGGAIVVGRDNDDVQRAVERRGGAEGAIVGTVPQVARGLRRFAEAGATHLVVSVVPNLPERWELAAELIAEIE